MLRFLPAILAAVTDLATTIIVYLHQPEYPPQFVIYQVAMCGFALLLAAPIRGLWLPACLLLSGGVFLAGFSVGMLYIPATLAAFWVMIKRLDHTPPLSPHTPTDS